VLLTFIILFLVSDCIKYGKLGTRLVIAVLKVPLRPSLPSLCLSNLVKPPHLISSGHHPFRPSLAATPRQLTFASSARPFFYRHSFFPHIYSTQVQRIGNPRPVGSTKGLIVSHGLTSPPARTSSCPQNTSVHPVLPFFQSVSPVNPSLSPIVGLAPRFPVQPPSSLSQRC
jgi:hypothetical protein